MAEIKIKCPDCGKEIKINIKTIDNLHKKIEVLKIEMAQLKKSSAPEDDDDFMDTFFDTLGIKR